MGCKKVKVRKHTRTVCPTPRRVRRGHGVSKCCPPAQGPGDIIYNLDAGWITRGSLDPSRLASGSLPWSSLRPLTELTSPVLNVGSASSFLPVYSSTLPGIQSSALSSVLAAGPSVFEGRLSSLSVNPVPTADNTNVTGLVYTWWLGDRVKLFDGTRWNVRRFQSEPTVSLSGIASGKNYDVFLVDNGVATPTMVLGPEWTDNVTRATGLTLVDGVYVLASDSTRVWVGTIRGSGSGRSADAFEARYVWNAWNRVPRRVNQLITTDTWTYASAAWRAIQGLSGTSRYAIRVVSGLVGLMADVQYSTVASSSGVSGEYYWIGWDIDAVTAPDTYCNVGFNVSTAASGSSMAETRLLAPANLGFTEFFPIEYTSGPATMTFYGDAGVAGHSFSLLQGWWDC